MSYRINKNKQIQIFQSKQFHLKLMLLTLHRFFKKTLIKLNFNINPKYLQERIKKNYKKIMKTFLTKMKIKL